MSSDFQTEFFCKENASSHHTIQYSLVHKQKLIIRRGQSFKMAIYFPDENSTSDYDITLEFSFGHHPNSDKGSHVILQVTKTDKFTRPETQWDVKREGTDSEKEMVIHVQVPATIGVGVWNISTILKSKENESLKKNSKIYVLFNPWCKEDSVYMENEDQRNECVLNDVGMLYSGTYAEYSSRRWVYGQFNASTLASCMYLLDLTGLLYNARSNPVLVARQISNMTNRSEGVKGDKGVLIGKWGKEEYKDGTAPWAWTGSTPILEEFLKNKGRSVKYGQCWVFAGLATTICRAIGIPARAVTCFTAGHDSDETLTIDIMFDSAGNRMTAISDSLWNFHVWTEVWMDRWDLPSGYGGWQVIDGTPQEISDGSYQMGPCPVLAVKKGEVGMLYDALFVFSEVNADLVNWIMRENELGFDRSGISTDYIGKMVLTKKVSKYNQDDEEPEDITSSYKYKEDTPEERKAVLNAARNAGKSMLFADDNDSENDVKIELRRLVNIMTGEDFQMSLKLENQSSEVRTVSVLLSCSSIHYNGVIVSKIKEERKTITLQKDQKEETLTSKPITANEYADELVEHGMIKVYGVASVKETNQTWAGEQDFVVKKPMLTLEIPSEVKVGEKYKFRVVFKNPYTKTLTGCMFSAEGPGLLSYEHRERGDISTEEEVAEEFDITPTYKCHTALVAAFISNELSDITGSKSVTVVK